MKCNFSKNWWDRCNANSMNWSEFCYLHNPDITDEHKRLNQAKWWKNRISKLGNPLPEIDITSTEHVVYLLSDTINSVRTWELDVKVANCLWVLSWHLLKALENVELKKKVDKIEQLLTK